MRCFAEQPSASRPGAKRLCLLLILSAAVAAGARAEAPAPAAQTGVPALDERSALAAGQAVVGQVVGDYTLLDRQGRQVRLSSFRGKPLLVSFIYTGCFQVCPASTRALHEAVKGLDKLLAPNQFNVVSIGFNQPFDSPAAMRAFAAQHRIDYPNWEFLSPPPAVVESLTREFGFSFVATPAGFDHVLGITLLDAQGRVHTQVYGERMNAEKIGEPLRQLLTQGTPPQGLRLAEVFERVRILCTVYDPDTGQYRYNYALLFEVIGGLLFFVSVGWYLLLEWREHRRARRPLAAAALPGGEPWR